jgi:hypothetical protein
MTEELHIITCSYGPDLERCRRLCETIDRFVPWRIRHSLIVPKRDLEKFAALANGRRDVRSTENTLPGRFRQLPGTQKWWLDGQGWPVRGWIVQQLTKMSADRVTDAPNLLFADSDIQFIRSFDESDVLQGGRLRLHHIPGAKQSGVHLTWHQRAGALLGKPREYAGADYVGQLITWRREHLRNMKSHIESVTRRPWHRAVGRTLRFSEYILYGMYVDHVLAHADDGHYRCDEDLCHCCWFAEDAHDLAQGQSRISAGAVALLLQSNLGLAAGEEAAIADLALEQLHNL